MPTILILILALLIATCIIAYWSDNLGKKLGKKRISLLGLRPRQTATFISMGSSVGIMLLTLGVLLGSSASLRNALTRYDQTKKENRQLTENNQRLQIQSNKLASASRKWEAQADKAREAARAALKQAEQDQKKAQQARHQLISARAELASARTRANAATQRAAQADAQYHTAKASLSSAQAQLTTAQSKLFAKGKQLLTAGAKLRSVTSRLRSVNAKIHSTQVKLAEEQRALATAQRALSSTQRALGATQRSMSTIQKTAYDNIEKLKVEIEQLTEEQQALEVERNVLEQEQRFLRVEKANLQAEIDKTQIVAGELATGNIEIPYGSVFAERTLSPDASRTSIRAALRSLLPEGQEALGNDRRIHLVPILPAGDTDVELTEEELISGLTEYISTMQGQVSVRLVAARGHAAGEETINVRFFTIPIETLFVKDSVIAQTVIDSAIGDVQIFGALLDLLNEGEAKARQRGASPLLTKDEPNFWKSDTRERIFEALRRIEKGGGAMEVRLVAVRDLTTVGPMQIRFDIRAQST